MYVLVYRRKNERGKSMTFQQRVADKVTKLRQQATRGGIYGEAYELFNKIKADPECNRMLREANKANKSMAERYNQHIRASNLPDADKRDLTIQ